MNIPQAQQISPQDQPLQVKTQPENTPNPAGVKETPTASVKMTPIKAQLSAEGTKFLTKSQVADIVRQRPSNVLPDDIVKGLVARGYTLEGFNDNVKSPFQTAQTAEAGTAQPQEQKTVGGFVGNVFKSAGGVVGGIFNAIMHPIKTVKTLGGIGVGAAEEAYGAVTGQNVQTDQTKLFDALKNVYGEKYGSWDKFQNSLYTDPVGVLLDASIVLDAGTSVVGKLADVAKVSGMAETANILTKTADALKVVKEAPGVALGKVGDVVKPVTTKISDVATNATIKSVGVMTGAGGETIKAGIEAVKAGGAEEAAYTAALRGAVTPEKIVENAQGFFEGLANKRSVEYQTALKGVKNSNVTLDLVPVKTELDNQLQKFGIQTLTGKNGKPVLDFSRSTLSTADEQKIVQGVFDDINSWGTKKGDLTPAGVDTLKRRIDNLYSPNKDARAIVQALKVSTKKVLTDNVEGYAKMTKAYQVASDTIDKLKDLSLGGKASNDTIFKKLASSLKDNQEYRNQLLQGLQAGADEKILTAQIAGYNLSPYIARGLTGRAVELLGGFKALAQPSILLPLAATSPRVVGEFLRVLGMKPAQISLMMNFVRAAKTGRIGQVITDVKNLSSNPQ
ncbi:MAG: hypothetical protein M1275_03205 [Patescibacteria group bacterium]|nr:hypothetical protein [Patescibacteria group bacterium]